MLVVSDKTAQELVTMADAIGVMEETFAKLESGDAEAFQVTRGHGPKPDSFFAVKAAMVRSLALVGCKVGTYWAQNRARGLENHGSTTLFLDPDTGFPSALVAASYLTALRTAAVDGLAVKHLARQDASVVGVVGAGHQAWFELLAVAEVRTVRRVLVWNRTKDTAQRFAARVRNELKLDAEAIELAETVKGSDILITITAAEAPIVLSEWVTPGTHISAMGADMPGKQELDVELIVRGKLFADVLAQSVSLGEFEAAEKSGRISVTDIATLGSVILDRRRGRTIPEEITIFDSSGTGIQDLTIGALALERAVLAGKAVAVDL